nr:hypothetical protein Iba_chr03bCG3910 [Ipomoea batatas]
MELKQQRNGQVAKNFSDLNNGSKKDLAASTIDRRPPIHCSATSLGEKKFAAASASNVDIENRVRQWQAQQSWRQTTKINFGDFHASTSSESDEAMKNPAPSGVGASTSSSVGGEGKNASEAGSPASMVYDDSNDSHRQHKDSCTVGRNPPAGDTDGTALRWLSYEMGSHPFVLFLNYLLLIPTDKYT